MILLFISSAGLFFNTYPISGNRYSEVSLSLDATLWNIFNPQIDGGVILSPSDKYSLILSPVRTRFLFCSNVKGTRVSMGPGFVFPGRGDGEYKLYPDMITPQVILSVAGTIKSIRYTAGCNYMLQGSARSSDLNLSFFFGDSLSIGLNGDLYGLMANGRFYTQGNLGVGVFYPFRRRMGLIVGVNLAIYSPIDKDGIAEISEDYWNGSHFSGWSIVAGVVFSAGRKRVENGEKERNVFLEVTDSSGKFIDCNMSIDGYGSLNFNGQEKISLRRGSYNVSIYANGYTPVDTLLVVNSDMFFHVTMKKSEKKGRVRIYCLISETGNPVKANVDIINSTTISASTDENGVLSISLKPETYLFRFSSDGCITVSRMYDVMADRTLVDTVYLEVVR